MVYLIKDTVDIYNFCKIDMKGRKNTCFKAASGFFEANREVAAFFFPNCRKLPYAKTSERGEGHSHIGSYQGRAARMGEFSRPTTCGSV